MTTTLISLISISLGIIGANSTEYFLKKYSFGLIGNTIAGVFGSAFLIKSFGRLGFDPKSIVQVDHVNMGLLAINIVVSFLGGVMAVILVYRLKQALN